MTNAAVERMLYPKEDFLASRNLELADASVIEVFKLMFGYDIYTVDDSNPAPPTSAQDERTAVVGFSGSMRGSCQIRISTSAARSIAAAMLGGAHIDEDDDSINDALGELCNMLAGGWKNSVHGLSSECALSPPTVISGCDYKVHTIRPSVKLSRTYRFDTHTLYLTLCREESGPVQS
jgi:chemotaxis protein CheX